MTQATLLEGFKTQVHKGLIRQSIISASRWAEKYRIMGQPEPGLWTFTRRPFLRELHDTEAEVNVIRKAAQLGLTETALNSILFEMDMFARDALYVLPSLGDARDFSAGRFNAAIDESEHIRTMFADVKNVGHKRARHANLYIRGGKSPSGLKSIPVSVLVLDELDEMSKRAVALALERQSGREHRKTWMISTPTIEKVGISAQFDLSTQESFFFKCPKCSKHITLEFPKNFKVIGDHPSDPLCHESYIKCDICKGQLEHANKWEYMASGEWVAKHKDKNVRGFALNQLYSPTVTPGQFAISYLKGLTDPADAQEFHNSKCGVPYVVPGGRVSDSEIDQCVGSHANGELKKGDRCRTIGIDVGGTWLHYEVDEWIIGATAIRDINRNSKCIVVEVGKVTQFEELDGIIGRLGVNFGVVDASPEKRKAFELATRHYGRFAICYYSPGKAARRINHSESDLKVTVDRTSWMDLALNRFRAKTISLPTDVPWEYREHIKEPAKRYERDEETGNPTVTFKSATDDHFAHCRVFSEIALATFLPNVAVSHNMGSVL